MTGGRLPEAILAALPQSVLVVDGANRFAFANAAFWQSIGVDPATCPPGTALRDLARLVAFRGFYGSGDPEALAEAVCAIDRSKPSRRQTGLPDGSRIFDTCSVPLPDGGFVSIAHEVTALVRAREDQAARARLLDATLGSLHAGLARFDAGMALRLFNPAYAQLLGLPGGVLRQGMTHRDIIALMVEMGEFDPDEADAVAERMEADRLRAATRERQRPAGPVLRFDTQPVPDGGFLLELGDITPLKRAEDEARRRAAVLDGVLAALPQGICVFDADRRVTMFNDAYARMMAGAGTTIGESVEALSARRVAQGEYDAETAARILARFAPGAAAPVIRRVRPNGIVLENSVAKLPDGGLISVLSDVTALHHAEAAARERAQTLDAVLEALPDGVVVYGPDRRARLTNPAYRRMHGDAAVRLGESMEEMTERRIAAGQLTRAMAETLLRRQRGPAEEAGVPVRRTLPDGTVIVSRAGRLPDGGRIAVLSDITALHQAQEELARRNAILEASFGAMRHGLALFDRDQRLLAANDAVAEMAGASPEADPRGRSFTALVEEQVAQGRLSAAEAASFLGADRSVPVRQMFERPDGRVFEILSDPTRDGGFVITFTDVTALRRAEEELGRRAAMLEASFGAMRHGIAIFDPAGQLLAINGRTFELTGIPPDAARPGTSHRAVLEAQVAAGWLGADKVDAVLGLDRTVPHRYLRRLPEGRVVEITSDPTPDGGFVLTFSDLTALHRAEEELRRRAALQEAMLGIIQHGIILYGPDRRVRAINPQTASLTGLPPAELRPGRPMDEMIDEQVARGELTPTRAAELKVLDRTIPHRYSRMRPDGRVIDTISAPTPDGGFALSYTDVTEERAIRAELERARSQAEAASEAKSRFLATMSHELRTPLNAVIGFSEAIAAERDRARIGDYAAMINEAGRTLLQLVDDILDVARSQTGSLSATDQPIEIARLATDAASAMAPAALAAGLTLVTELAPALPWLRGDPRRLRQALDKLLSNAVKFTPAGGRVTLGAAVDAAGLAIRVADTGIGIAREDRERAFEPFTQLDSSLARRFHGSGLGLHLARTLVAALGGTLELEGPEGPGLVAVLRFPPDRLVPSPYESGTPPA